MGLPQRIRGIVPKGPVASLLTAAGRLPAGTDWRSGVAFRQTHCAASGRWALCPGVDDEKDSPSGIDLAAFFPFTGYVPAQCDWMQQENAQAEFDPEVMQQLEAASAWELSRELWTGETNAGGENASPSLQAPFPGETDEFDPTHVFSSAASPRDAIANLIAAYADHTKVAGAVLHIPLVLMPHLLTENTLRLNGSVFELPGLAAVSPGPGYPDDGTTGPKTQAHPAGAVAAAGQAWIYVTSPVETEMGPIRREPEQAIASWFDRRTNQYYVLAEREMIYRFEPCAVWAALVTVP